MAEHGDHAAFRKTLARAIKHRLIDLDWNQSDLARAVGISDKHVSTLMTGRQGMSDEMLDKVAEVTGCEWRIALEPSQIVRRPSEHY